MRGYWQIRKEKRRLRKVRLARARAFKAFLRSGPDLDPLRIHRSKEVARTIELLEE
jgi:hypothetical protein